MKEATPPPAKEDTPVPEVEEWKVTRWPRAASNTETSANVIGWLTLTPISFFPAGLPSRECDNIAD